MKTGALVLAAGRASRFGSPKQLLEIRGETLIDRACRTAGEAGCDPVLRVLGAHADKILDRKCPTGVATFVHVGWEQGMGSSLAAGVSHLLDLVPELQAILILLADQPMITVGLIDSMCAGLDDSSVVWCGYGEVEGPPVLFASRHFPALQALRGDRGAKSIVIKHQALVVPFPGGSWDIDSPSAWQAFLADLEKCGKVID